MCNFAHPGFLSAAVLVRGRDIQEHDFVGPFDVVAARQFRRMAHVPQVLELNALHHAAILHIQTGNDALGCH